MAVDRTPRAVVADDSHFMRTVITDILEDAGIDVVAVAGNGREAVSSVREHDPDVVTMDVEMPGMDGIEATERIMDEQPTPILMLSAHTDENAEVTFEALERGAVDFLRKPGGEVSMEMSGLRDQLVGTVESVASIDPTAADDVSSARSAGTATGTASTASTGSPASTGSAPSTESTSSAGSASSTESAPSTGSTPSTGSAPSAGSPAATAGSGRESTTRYVDDPTVVIGSSTGGPTVVETVLSSLPLAADLRVLVVQHMPSGFTGRFADRLDARSEYHIREAADGVSIGGGEALIAPGDYHLEVTNYRSGRLGVSVTQDPPVNNVRPAVDVTMETAAAVVDDPLVGVILTGMGEDGAAGVRSIAEAGGTTIAQDEATSAVFGMPKRAIETGCVDGVAPVDDVARAILDTLEVTPNE